MMIIKTYDSSGEQILAVGLFPPPGLSESKNETI